jgi:hypothetical protein
MKELSSLARKTMARAISSGAACLPSGIMPSKMAAAVSLSAPVADSSTMCWNSLSTGPGWIVLTRMPRGASSAAIVRISPTCACLAVE